MDMKKWQSWVKVAILISRPGSSIGKIGFAKYNRYGKRNGQIRNFKD